MDAGALDQRHREPRFRIPGLRVRIRLHLGRQQPREPAHGLVERSGLRSPRRGPVHPGRGDRRSLDPDAAARPRGLALRRPSRTGLHPLRAREPRRGAGAAPVRPALGPGQDLPPADREPRRGSSPALGDRVRRVGPRLVAQRLRAFRPDAARRTDPRPFRAQPVE